jgi:chemotaxis regulatin CheY-phosphate phosphatase CheZ
MMMTKDYQELAELVIEKLLDSDGELEGFLHVLKSEAASQSKRAHESADDYTVEELNKYEQLEYDAAKRVHVGTRVAA